MTINVPIRPGAALTDPGTRQFVEDTILNASYDVITRNSYIPDRAYNKEGIVNILANFPWRTYTYKFGRWQRIPVLQGHITFFPSWRAWEQKFHSIMLTDPDTGRDIAELNGMAKHVQRPGGTLLFAGDPHYAGVIDSTTTKGKRALSIVGNIRLMGDPENRIDVANKAKEITKTLTPGHPPNVRLYDPSPKYTQHLGPWLADHPLPNLS